MNRGWWSGSDRVNSMLLNRRGRQRVRQVYKQMRHSGIGREAARECVYQLVDAGVAAARHGVTLPAPACTLGQARARIDAASMWLQRAVAA